MRKYLIVGGVGLLSVVGIAFFLLHQQKLLLAVNGEQYNNLRGQVGTLLDVVPAQLDQMVYMKVDDGLITVLEETGQQPEEGFREAMQGVNELAAIQYTAADGIYSVLLIDAQSEEDIQKVENIGLIVGGAGFSYEQISDKIWAYGDAISLGWYQSLSTTDTFTSESQWESFVDQLEEGGYNMAFVSTPGRVPNNNPIVMQFADQLEYTMALSHLAPGDVRGEIIIQFIDGVIATREQSFMPQLASKASSQSTIYLEMQGLLPALAIEREQFNQLAPLFLQQYNPALASLLSSDEYGTLYDILSANIALSLHPQQNMFGAGVSLYLAHPQAFTLMEKLTPFRGALADSLLGSGALLPIDQPEGFAFGIEGLALFGDEAVLQLTRDEEVAIISVLGVPRTNDGMVGLSYSDNTIISFIVDGAGLQQQLQSGVGGIGNMLPIAEGSSYISGQTILGDLQMVGSESQLRLSFSVKE